ncbi:MULTISPECIES: YrhA family protein [unclassified Butyrivibrio]|uniref:YrhA family protein n=1 Tax=unclassified Butyrivibrio TaxID=2639466 RepID=UPI000406172A|nr:MULTISPECIES: YrhA family protein [unclassified Butyrivibrio]
MWEKEIGQLRDFYSQIGKELNAPAKDNEIAKFESEAKKRLGQEIPDEHMALFKIVNGFSFNGVNVYGVDEELLEKKPEEVYSFIELNEMWKRHYEGNGLYLADTDLYFYVFDSKNGGYYRLTNPMGDEDKKYNSYEDMMKDIFDECLE